MYICFYSISKNLIDTACVSKIRMFYGVIVHKSWNFIMAFILHRALSTKSPNCLKKMENFLDRFRFYTCINLSLIVYWPGGRVLSCLATVCNWWRCRCFATCRSCSVWLDRTMFLWHPRKKLYCHLLHFTIFNIHIQWIIAKRIIRSRILLVKRKKFSSYKLM